MRQIIKGSEPPLLRAFKKRSLKNIGSTSGQKGARAKSVLPTPKYKDLDIPVREQLVQSLLREQGYTCCYCMGRIDESNMRVEHWHPRSHYSTEQLEYSNLLAACNGNEGGGAAHEHCDVKKGNRLITYNPADRNVDIEGKIQYSINGKMKTVKGEDEFKEDIESVLNLNCEWLVEDRRRAINGATNALRRNLKRLTPKQISSWELKDAEGCLQPRSGAVLYILKRLAKKAKYGSAKRAPSGPRKPS